MGPLLRVAPVMRRRSGVAANSAKRERSRSPRRGRSRSPGRSGRRRSYSDRSRSPGDSRDDFHRQRSPMSGAGAPGGGSSIGYSGGPQHRSFEDRQAAKEQRMNSIRETSQQDRRVYVGNLSYDVKWHHLKDFMRQGKSSPSTLPCLLAQRTLLVLESRATSIVPLFLSTLAGKVLLTYLFTQPERCFSQRCCSFRMECRRWAPTRSLLAGFLLWFPSLFGLDGMVGLTGWDAVRRVL